MPSASPLSRVVRISGAAFCTSSLAPCALSTPRSPSQAWILSKAWLTIAEISAEFAEIPPNTSRKMSAPIATRPSSTRHRAADTRHPVAFQPARAGPATAPRTAAVITGMTIVDVWPSNQTTPRMIPTKPTSSHDENPRSLSRAGAAKRTLRSDAIGSGFAATPRNPRTRERPVQATGERRDGRRCRAGQRGRPHARHQPAGQMGQRSHPPLLGEAGLHELTPGVSVTKPKPVSTGPGHEGDDARRHSTGASRTPIPSETNEARHDRDELARTTRARSRRTRLAARHRARTCHAGGAEPGIRDGFGLGRRAGAQVRACRSREKGSGLEPPRRRPPRYRVGRIRAAAVRDAGATLAAPLMSGVFTGRELTPARTRTAASTDRARRRRVDAVRQRARRGRPVRRLRSATLDRRVVGMCDSNSGDHDGESGRTGADTRPTGHVQRLPGIPLLQPARPKSGGSQAQIENGIQHAETLRNPAAIGHCGRWRDPDSNRGHHDFQSCALPTELSRRGANRLARRGPRLELRERVDRRAMPSTSTSRRARSRSAGAGPTRRRCCRPARTAGRRPAPAPFATRDRARRRGA